MSNRIDASLVCQALQMVIDLRGSSNLVGAIVHTDRGSQYASERFTDLLKRHKMIGSMSRKGNCWDNAPSESFFGTCKIENIYTHAYQTREEAKSSIFQYIESYYNRQRLHSHIGYQTPVDFEKNLNR